MLNYDDGLTQIFDSILQRLMLALLMMCRSPIIALQVQYSLSSEVYG
jgi:hypothetical protein